MGEGEMIQAHYYNFVRERLAAGDNPNVITRGIEEALITEAKDWVLFGDGRWRQDTVCSICGLWTAGVCGHQDDPTREIILRSAYLARQTQ